MADERAGAFRALHRRGNPLVLANVWDAASARLVEASGAPAIATSSAGMAWSLGYADGECVDVDEMLAAVRRVVRTVRIPVSADMEAGYGGTEALLGVMERLVQTGAVGVNLEDWDVQTEDVFPLDVARERIAAVKARFGDTLFLNARTDIYLQEVGEEAMRFDATVARLRAFAEAGADGVFVPGLAGAATIGKLAAATDKPLNVLARPGSPSVADLAKLGVARISTGSSPALRIFGEMQALAEELAADGTYPFVHARHSLGYAQVNDLFETRPR